MANMWSLSKVRSVYVKVKSLSVHDQRVSASHASPKVKCQSRLRHLEMELGMSDLTAPFTVDQARQGPLKQHKWGPCVPVPIHAQYLRKVQRYKGTCHPGTLGGARAFGAELALGDGRAIGCSGQLTV